ECFEFPAAEDFEFFEAILSILLILSESDSSTEFTESTELPAPLDFSELILSILLILSDNKKSRARKNARLSPRFLRRHYPHQVQGVVHQPGPLSQQRLPRTFTLSYDHKN